MSAKKKLGKSQEIITPVASVYLHINNGGFTHEVKTKNIVDTDGTTTNYIEVDVTLDNFGHFARHSVSVSLAGLRALAEMYADAVKQAEAQKLSGTKFEKDFVAVGKYKGKKS